MKLAGLEVRDSDVLALARLLRQSGSTDTAERLERAYDVETKLLALTLAERDEILGALEEAPAGLATLRAARPRPRAVDARRARVATAI